MVAKIVLKLVQHMFVWRMIESLTCISAMGRVWTPGCFIQLCRSCRLDVDCQYCATIDASSCFLHLHLQLHLHQLFRLTSAPMNGGAGKGNFSKAPTSSPGINPRKKHMVQAITLAPSSFVGIWQLNNRRSSFWLLSFYRKGRTNVRNCMSNWAEGELSNRYTYRGGRW